MSVPSGPVEAAKASLRPAGLPSAVIDLHTDALYEHVQGRKDIGTRSHEGHVDLPRLREGGVTGQVFAIWINPEKYAEGERAPFVDRALDSFDALCRDHSDQLTRTLTPTGVAAANAAGRIAGIPAIEGGHALEGDLDRLATFHQRGVRMLTLVWNNTNELAESWLEDTGAGLSTLGREAIRMMTGLGIAVDLSHASTRTFWDVIEASTVPVVASHSGARSRCDHPRNLDDEQLHSLGESGGVVGTVFLPAFLRPEPEPTALVDVLDHIEHIADKAGIDAVAIGADYDGFAAQGPVGLEDVSRLPALTAGLSSRGFSDQDIAKVMGGNFLRAWTEILGHAGDDR